MQTSHVFQSHDHCTVSRRSLRTCRQPGQPRHFTRARLSVMAPEKREYDQRWNDIWEAGLTEGERFDAASSSPALLAIIKEGNFQVRGKRVFVPGCGRGYDVVEFAKQGAVSVVGMELVPEATTSAQEYLHKSDLEPTQRERSEIVTGDFFDIKAQNNYDVGYDYTFFCAMDPSMRQKWAEAWSHWLAPGGELVTVMFPVEPEGREGPPWPVPLQLYDDTLSPSGFIRTYLGQVPDEQCHKGREGKTWIGRWTKQMPQAEQKKQI